MNDDLRDLYQEVIIEHNKNPRNYGPLETANRNAEGRNPLCGDQVHIYLEMNGEVIKDIHFEGQGCAISTSSASLMTSALKGKTRQEADDLYQEFRKLVTLGHEPDQIMINSLGKLAVFAGVRDYPSRVKCASLPWHALHAALQDASEPVSTE